MSYQLINDQTVRRLSDGAFVPIGSRGPAGREYSAWLAEGNLPLPADPEPVLPNWRGFLRDLRGTVVFTSLRGQARRDVAANALATELRTLLGEAALGLIEEDAIQALLSELLPSLPAPQVAEIQAAIAANNIPLQVQ